MSEIAAQRPYHHGQLRTSFLEAAEISLREHGADRLSLRDVAREVGVSHAAPRRHFGDRQGLLDALAETGFVRLGDALRTALADRDVDFATRVHAGVATSIAFATGNRSLYELMNAAKHRSGAQGVIDAADAAYRPMVELIEEGQRRGLLDAGDPEPIGMVLFATAQGIAILRNGGLIREDILAKLTALAVTQFLRGAHPLRT